MVYAYVRRIGQVSIVLVHLLIGVCIFGWIPSYRLRHLARMHWGSLTTRASVWLHGINVKMLGEENIPKGACVFLGNHMSWVDVLMLLSRIPCVFVTSTDTEKNLVLGETSRCGGAIFVDRNNPTRLKTELRHMTDILRDDKKIFVFPEATSHDGSALLSFKRALVQAACIAKVPVVPVCINYRKVNGEVMQAKFRDHLFYYGDLAFGPQFSRFTKLRKVEAEIQFFPSIDPELGSREVTARAFEVIDKHFVKIPYSQDELNKSA